MRKTIELLPPLMPNFISYYLSGNTREEGQIENSKIDIRYLSKEEAIEYAELLKTTFLSHWETKTSKFLEDHITKGWDGTLKEDR